MIHSDIAFVSSLLNNSDAKEAKEALQVLSGGATSSVVSGGSIPLSEVVKIYRRRERLSEKLGLISGNFRSALSALEHATCASVVLYSFDSLEDTTFVVFVDPNTSQMISVLRVARALGGSKGS